MIAPILFLFTISAGTPDVKPEPRIRVESHVLAQESGDKARFLKTLEVLNAEITSIDKANEDISFIRPNSFKHSKAAENVGLNLSPTEVLIFGNPKAGTILMQENPQIAMELPVKLLVYQQQNEITGENQIFVEYMNPHYWEVRYALQEEKSRKIIQKMTGLLDKIVSSVESSK